MKDSIDPEKACAKRSVLWGTGISAPAARSLNPKSGRWLPDHTHLQSHVNAAIAYNVWQYFKTTGDLEFLSTCGAEMILEIARFLAGTPPFNQKLERCETRKVMGPDEYHDGYPESQKPGLKNNEYTVIMAVYTLRTAFKALEALLPKRREDLQEALGLQQAELHRWQDIMQKMRGPIPQRRNHQPVRGMP